jgi:hypothetical protein
VKLLLLAANPGTSSSLSLEREVTALQRQFLDVSPEPFDFIVLPDLRIEDLPEELRRVAPDILHVCAHGETPHLAWADRSGTSVNVTPKALTAFLSPDRPPKLIYFNGCQSTEMAQGVLGPVEMAIGTTATITNGDARATAASFYRCLLGGESVATAFATAEELSRAKGIPLDLRVRDGVSPSQVIMRRRPHLVARFARVRREPDGTFPIRVGVSQCPELTTQLVAFLGGDTNQAIATSPEWTDTTAWVRRELDVASYTRMFVAGVISGERHFIAQCELYDLLRKQKGRGIKWARDALRGNTNGASSSGRQ